MARDKTTFIKLDRNIMEWRWYKETTTKVLFIHLLLRANFKDADFMTETIHRGELVTSYPALAAETGLSIKQVRTALEHLKETGEVAVRRQSKFSIISILCYDYYQRGGQSEGMSEGSQRAVKGQQYKNNKKNKEGGRNARTRATPASQDKSPDGGSPWIVEDEERSVAE